MKEYESVIKELDKSTEELRKLIQKTKLPETETKKLERQSNIIQQMKTEKKECEEYLRELEQREKKLMSCTECSEHLCKESFFESKIPDELKNNDAVTQVGNVVFFNTEIGEQIKNYILKLIKSNKDKKYPTFYIASEEKHWYVIAQQGEQVFDLNVSSMRGNIDLSSTEPGPDEKLTYFKYNTNGDRGQKLQYSSGCCEMYCVLLPYLLTRCMFFNRITELKDLFIVNKNSFTFQPFLYKGLCEKAFSQDSTSDKKLGVITQKLTEKIEQNEGETLEPIFIDNRRELLEVQKKSVDISGTIIPLLYNSHTTFQEIFSQYLSSEISYIQYMQHNYEIKDRKIKAANMKGGFIYRYAITMSNMSDPEYKKHLQVYFEKCLKKPHEKLLEKCQNVEEQYRKIFEEYKKIEACKELVEIHEKLLEEYEKALMEYEESPEKFEEKYKELLKKYDEACKKLKLSEEFKKNTHKSLKDVKNTRNL